jgi:DNA (cytosine-5)-methyltransferase 1
LEYGLERSGLSTSCEWMIEMDEFCCTVLEKNFPNTLVINKKVEEINPLDLPSIDILTAGFPCQPVSTAGSRKGIEDERWLWDEVWRFIDVLRPRYFLLENVPGIFTANKGKAFERVIKDIAESRSYRFEWQIISARTVGAAHLRKRFFGVGILGNTEHNGSSKSENRRSTGERFVQGRQGEEVKEKINRESKGESKHMEHTISKSSNKTDKQTRSISESRNTRTYIGDGCGGEESKIDRQEAELWMGSTAYGFPRWMARLGLVNVWSANLNKWRTPTTMDKKEDALKHATKLLQGKNTRASGEPVQITLADQIAMEDIKNNPKLYEKYKDHKILKRPYLPKQKLFVDYLRSVTSIKELNQQTKIKKTTIEHWFRYDEKGFSFPSLEDWETIKPLLKEIKFDKEMTTVESFEWSNNIEPFPTPASRDWKDTYDSNLEPNHLIGGVPAHKKTMPRNVFYRQQKQEEYPTPSSSEHKYRLKGNTQASKNLEARSRRGELNAEYDVWEQGMPRSAGDYPNRKQKLMGLGNAVVPQCVELVGRLIKRSDELGTMVFDIDIKEK